MSRTPAAPPRPPLDGPPPRPPSPRTGTRRGAAPLPRGVVIALVIAVLGLLVALQLANPGAIEGTLRSPTAVALVAGTIAAFVVAGLVLRRVGVAPAARLLLLAVPAAAVFGVYLLPSFQSGTVVDEALPDVAPVAAGDASAGADDAGDADPDADPDPDADAADGPLEPAPAAAPTDPVEADGAAAPDAPAAPTRITSGTFVGLDGHSATGVGAIYRLGDGSHLVRLEDVDLQNTPAPVVYLVPGPEATEPGPDFVDLGPLTGNIGSSNYPVPAGTDLTGDWTILVWCSTFASPIGGATQA